MVKITRNHKSYLRILLLLSITIASMFSLFVPVKASEKVDRVYDYTNSLSDEQEQELEDLVEKYYNKSNYNFLIVITDTLSEYSYDSSGNSDTDCELYSVAFYESFQETYEQKYPNCAILAIDIKNRYAYVSGFGELKTQLDDNRCDLVFKKITPQLKRDKWFAACKKYVHQAYNYSKFKEGIDPGNIFYNTFLQLGIALVIGGVVIAVLIINSGGKMTVSAMTYLDENNSRVVAQHDHYVRTSTHRTKRSSSSSSGGSSSGGGGSSHSGSGGHF